MSTALPKADLIRNVAADASVSKAQAEAVLAALGPVIRTSTANGYTVALPGLGRFAAKVRAARVGRNPATGAPLDIPESTVLTFKASKASKAAS